MAHSRPQHDLIDAAALSGRQLDEVGKGFGRVVRAFAEAAGEDLARMVTATRLRDGELTVRCASSAWAQTVGFMETDLLERLQRNHPELAIARIRVISGGIAPPPPPAPAPERLPDLDADAHARLERLVAPITDPALRRRVLAAADAAERRRRADVNPA